MHGIAIFSQFLHILYFSDPASFKLDFDMTTW